MVWTSSPSQRMGPKALDPRPTLIHLTIILYKWGQRPFYFVMFMMIGINFPKHFYKDFFSFLHFNSIVCDQFQIWVDCKWKICERNWVILDILGSQWLSSSPKGHVQLCCIAKCQGQLSSNWELKRKLFLPQICHTDSEKGSLFY